VIESLSLKCCLLSLDLRQQPFNLRFRICQGRGDGGRVGGVEEALGFGDLLVDFLEERAEFVGCLGGEGGDAGEGGVDAFEEAGFGAFEVGDRFGLRKCGRARAR
jgi:hypothetical protein